MTDLGCFDHTQDIPLGINAPTDGTYRIMARFNGRVVNHKPELLEGEPIVIPAGILNEDYQYRLHLFNQNGEFMADFTAKVSVLIP